MKRNKAILCAVASFGLITAANTINANAMTMNNTASCVQAKLTASEVADLINKLPYTVTLGNKEQFKTAINDYKSLDENEKSKIDEDTLYYLKSAEGRLQKLEAGESKAKELVQRIEALKVSVGYNPDVKYDLNKDNAKKIRNNMTEIQNIREDYEKLDYSIRYGENNLVTNYKDFSTIECMLSQAAWMQ